MDFDYRIFLQDELWRSERSYLCLATMTQEEVFEALEQLFCAAEQHYKGMIRWYEATYRRFLVDDAIPNSAFLGFLIDYETIAGKTPHQWLRDSILGQALEEQLGVKF